MQVDWCQVRRGKNRFSALVATMGHCRATYVQFATNEELDTLLACLEDAFSFFGGVPRHVLFDNMKTVVLERDAYGVGEHRYQPLPPPWRKTASALPANVVSLANMKGSFQPPLKVFEDVVVLAS